ncbi:MAG: hypothetical protein AABX05_01070 [Nanoarchaeota archaeon]
MTAPPEKIFNLSVWSLPAHLGGYEYCRVKTYASSGGGRTTITISNEELAFVRKLHLAYKVPENETGKESAAPKGFVFPRNNPQLEEMIFRLAFNRLVEVKEGKVSLSQTAYVAEYDLIPYEHKV